MPSEAGADHVRYHGYTLRANRTTPHQHTRNPSLAYEVTHIAAGRLIVGDEEINGDAISTINLLLRGKERAIALSGFDFGTKVIAVTDQRVLIADENDGIVLNLRHDNISVMRRDGRTLIIRAKDGEEHHHRFGKDQTVQELVEIAWRQIATGKRSTTGASQTNRPSATGGNRQTAQAQPENGRQIHIGERVKFWEEQDRINQELIPRVIQQSEVLTGHIKNHENLQATAVKMVRETVEESESRINQQLQAAQEERQLAEENLRQASEERQAAEAIIQQVSEERQAAEKQLREVGEEHQRAQEQLRQTAEERQAQTAQWELIAEERQKHQKELEAAASEREEMKSQHAGEVVALKNHGRRMTVIAGAAVTLAGAAIILAVLL